MKKMDVTIIGAGAVGLGVASCLLARDVGVRLVVRNKIHRLALESDGLSRTGLFGDVHFGPETFSVSEDLDVLADTLDTADEELWLVCVKSNSSSELAGLIAPLWKRRQQRRPRTQGPRIVLFQNGWGNAEKFAEKIPREQIYNARVITGFDRRDPSRVEITVHADSIHIGSLFGASLAPILPLVRAIDDGGIPCASSPEIEQDLWAKMLYNIILNPLGALLDVPYGALGERRETREIMAGLTREIFCVLEATGYRTHWKTADAYLDTFYQKLLPPTQKHESSMLQDLRAGRRTEIDALCGAICRLAREHELGVPINRSLADLIHAAEDRQASQTGAG